MSINANANTNTNTGTGTNTNTNTGAGAGNGTGALSKLKNRFSRSFGSKAGSPQSGLATSNDGPAHQQQPRSVSDSPALTATPVTASPPNEALNNDIAQTVVAKQTSSAHVSDPSEATKAATFALALSCKDGASLEPAPGDLLADYSSSSRSLGEAKSELRKLYPKIEPFRTGRLKVSSEEEGGHELNWELSGKEGGHPVVFLHGGPGGGCSADDRRWFDPQHYQILTFDQRGAGKSTPAAELKGNTTWDLVADIERLRTEVAKVEKWHVFGGSWGSTLSLAYAQTHPSRVSALVLRGIFALRREELLFFYQEGSNFLWPEQFEPYLNHIPIEERTDMIAAYYKRLTSDDAGVRLLAARRWVTWENATSKLYLDQKHIARGDDDMWSLQFARIESHFFQNRGWMEDGFLLKPENIAKITHIPTVVVQGRYDVVCPMKTCWELRNAWVKAQEDAKTKGKAGNLELFIIPDAGHASREPGVADKLLYATDKLRSIGREPDVTPQTFADVLTAAQRYSQAPAPTFVLARKPDPPVVLG